MSTADLVIDKIKSLTEEEVRSVLSFIARLPHSHRWTAQELLLLPWQERNRILQTQMTKASQLYRDHPDLIMDVVDAPLEYE